MDSFISSLNIELALGFFIPILIAGLSVALYFVLRKTGVLDLRPKSFWAAIIGINGIVSLSLVDWIDATVRFIYQDVSVRFNFRMLLGNFDATGLYFIGTPSNDPGIVSQNMSLYSTTRLITFICAALIIAALVLLVFSVIMYRSRFRIKATMLGLSLTALSSLLFVFYFVFTTGETTGSGLTVSPLLLLALSLISMMYVKEPLDIENKKLRKFMHQKALIFMTVPIMVYVFIFNYLPLTGWVMAFQDFAPGQDVNPWVGFEHFEFFFKGDFLRVMRNTLAMSLINLVLGFSTAIFLALMINELRNKYFKRISQTISYLPHFLSWVIAAALIGQFLAGDGILNQIMMWLGVREVGDPRLFRAEPDSFWWIIGWGNVWKSVGWNTIIYLAAITSIDPELYESAELDGAGRFAKMRHITLPGIKSTILVLLIMSIGWILNAGFEPQYLLGNVLVRSHATTIDIFVIEYGFAAYNYSLATAVGMFKTVVSIILITGANQLSKRIAKESLV